MIFIKFLHLSMQKIVMKSLHLIKKQKQIYMENRKNLITKTDILQSYTIFKMKHLSNVFSRKLTIKLRIER